MRFLRGSRVPTNRMNAWGSRYFVRTRSTSCADTSTMSTPSGTWRIRSAGMPAATQSSVVAALELMTSDARLLIARRLWRIRRAPWRVNCSGRCMKARSCTVTTSGWLVAAGMSPVACTTSTAPVTDSTFGQRRRTHVSYSSGRDKGSIDNEPTGRYDAPGSWACRPATWRSSMSSRRSSSRAIRKAAIAVPPGTGCQHCSSV